MLYTQKDNIDGNIEHDNVVEEQTSNFCPSFYRLLTCEFLGIERKIDEFLMTSAKVCNMLIGSRLRVYKSCKRK